MTAYESVTTEIPLPEFGTCALIQDLLKGMVEKRASDLHLRSGTQPIYRIDGHLTPTGRPVVTPDTARDKVFRRTVRAKGVSPDAPVKPPTPRL